MKARSIRVFTAIAIAVWLFVTPSCSRQSIALTEVTILPTGPDDRSLTEVTNAFYDRKSSRDIPHKRIPRGKLPNLIGDTLTGRYISFYDSTKVSVNCELRNVGDTTFYSVDSLNECFIYIKVMKTETGQCWEYCKSNFHATIPVNGLDEYYEDLTLFGAGHYIVLNRYNRYQLYAESSYRDNDFFYAFRFTRDPRFPTLDYWEGIPDSTLLTQKNKNKLLHAK